MSPVSSSFLTKPRLQHLMLTAEIGQIHPRFAVGKIQNATRTEKQDRQNQSVTTNPADFTIGGQRASCQAKKCQMALGASPTPSQKAERRLGTGAGEHVPIRAVQGMSLDIRILDIVRGGMSIIRFSSPKGSEAFPVFFWLKINPRCSGRREELAGDWKLLCSPANSNQTRAPSLFLNRRKDDASIFACLCGSTATGWRETVVCPWFFLLWFFLLVFLDTLHVDLVIPRMGSYELDPGDPWAKGAMLGKSHRLGNVSLTPLTRRGGC